MKIKKLAAMNRIDKFFNDKLYNHRKKAPASAWSKLEEKLNQQKPKPFAWWRIAAAVSLLLIGSFILWKIRGEKEQKFIVVATDNQLRSAEVAPNSEPQEIENSDSEKFLTNTKERIKKKSAPPNPAPVEVDSTANVPAHDQFLTYKAEVTPPDSLQLPAIAEASEIFAGDEVANVATKEDYIKIVLSKEEVNQKYLRKNTDAEATSEEKDPSTIEKLLDKAYDLKHNQDPVGVLRQKKDEIFALDFRKEQPSQNR